MPIPFETSSQYWEERYARGLTSGAGSYGRMAEFKSRILNAFVEEHALRTVIEFGCGDGNQLSLARYPHCVGFDVSPTALALCAAKFGEDPTKAFRLMADYAGETADLTLSLDVIYHLIEDDVFEAYMRRLFEAARRFVAVYSSNDASLKDRNVHVWHRNVTDWVSANVPAFRLYRTIWNEHRFVDRPPDARPGEYSPSDFYIYERVGSLPSMR